MKNKIAIAVSAALMGIYGYASASPLPKQSIQIPNNLKHNTHVTKGESSKGSKVKFVKETGLTSQKYTYIVRLTDAPVASYSGTVSGLASTKVAHTSAAKTKNTKLNISSAKVRSYVQYLKSKQNTVMMMASAAGVPITVKQQYHYAFNGFAADLTPEQAEKLSQLPEVAYVEREAVYQLTTDTSPAFIGADKVWDGTATGTAAMGEGVIVGVLDSGVNTDHPSFADIGGDGYDHTNPWGQGVYVGDCAEEQFSSMCNDKLIGIRSYASITDNYDDTAVFGDTPPAKNGEDYNGHGSHTASTAAGNVLLDVPYVVPEAGVEESDGIVTNLVFDRVAGIAPHANIVAYQICAPGDTDDTYGGCPTSAILQALDDAVADGVDVINYSISGGGNPWDSATEMGFLAARDAGIFSAVSAGNGTQTASSTNKNAPWYTAVAASTHPRAIGSAVTVAGANYFYTAGTGPVLQEDITAPVTYLADNLNGCDTITADLSGQIALIQRGTCNFAAKVTNAESAGAVGVIVFNAEGDDSRISMAGLADTTIPAVFIGYSDGAAIRAAIDADSQQTATLSADVIVTEDQGDVLADFSLIGPNSAGIDVITPSISAPGVDIYAAHSDQQFGHDVTGPAPSDYTLMSGTSMAAPHVAGAAALLKSAHPTWTPDNIRSALMMTATTAQAMTKADAETPADPFDVGAGRLRVDLAAKAGLVMDEVDQNYVNADPDLGGDPKSLNIPSMANSRCVTTCSWTRTVTATAAGSWSAVGSAINSQSGLTISVSPATFTLAEGESQTLTITADVADLTDSSNYVFGQLQLTSDDYPTATMPIAVKPARSNLPAMFSIPAGRDKDQFVVDELRHLDFTGVQASVTALAKADIYQSTVGQDSDVSDFLDDITDGVDYIAYEVPEGTQVFMTELSSEEAPDLDLWVMADIDGDGSLDGMVGFSAVGGSNESVTVNNPIPGTYYIFIQSYQASSPTAQDAFTLKTTIATDEAGDNFSVDLTGDNTDFSLTYSWDDSFEVGDSGYATLSLTSTDETQDDISVPVLFSREEDDVVLPLASSLSGELQPGIAHTINIAVAGNNSAVARTYTINALLPVEHNVEADNVSDNGQISFGNVNWVITQAPHATAANASFDFIPRKAGDYTLTFNHIVDSANAERVSKDYNFSVPEVAPELVVSAPTEVGERESFTLDASESSDANGDDLTFAWVQRAGTPLSFDASAATITVDAPDVDDAGEILTFQVTVSDTNGNSDTQLVTVNVHETANHQGGAFGWISLLLMPLVWLRRKTA